MTEKEIERDLNRCCFMLNWAVHIWSTWSDNVSDREAWEDAKGALYLSLKHSVFPITQPIILDMLKTAKQLLFYRHVAERLLDKTRKDKVSKVPYRAFKYVLRVYLQEIYGNKYTELPETQLTR